MVVELEMGPTGAMRLLQLGEPYQVPRPDIAAGTVRGGNYLHVSKGYSGEGFVRRRKWMKNFGIRLYAIGVPDELDRDEGLVVEFKTYSDPQEILYQVERGIFQACFYCWMLGFERFKKFRILLYNTNTDEVDIIIERLVEPNKFFKKLRKAIRLGIDEMENGKRSRPRKKVKQGKICYWTLRVFDLFEVGYQEDIPFRNRGLTVNLNPAEEFAWLMKRFDEITLS